MSVPPVALYFNLALLARTRAEADACTAFFAARALEVEGRPVTLETGVGPRGDLFLVAVWPRGMSYASPHGDDRRLTKEENQRVIERWFDDALIAAPPFVVATFGAEAYDSFLDDEPLLEKIEGGHAALFVDAPTYDALGCPSGAREVAPGRWFWPRFPEGRQT